MIHPFERKRKERSIVMKGKCVEIVTVVVAIACTALWPCLSYAWGPSERETYTSEAPASYAIFNSITNNEAVGDERNFVRIGELNATAPYTDEIVIEPGKEYEVYIYYHNNAAEDTNDSGYGIATAAKVASSYPAVVEQGTVGTVTGNITWNYVDYNDETHDGIVWDEAFVTTEADCVTLKYKVGSAVIHNFGEVNGSVLSEDFFSEQGTAIGYNELKGVIPGGAEYSGYITYTLTASEPESVRRICKQDIVLALIVLAEVMAAAVSGLRKAKKSNKRR